MGNLSLKPLTHSTLVVEFRLINMLIKFASPRTRRPKPASVEKVGSFCLDDKVTNADMC